MKNNKILSYDDVKKIKNGKVNERLVDVRSYDNSIVAEYEKFDMVVYTGLEVLVRRTVAQKLADVNGRLRKKYNLMIKVVYGYRAPEVQARYFNKRRAEINLANPGMSSEELDAYTHSFVAVPDVAGHTTGGAVDITLINAAGEPCNMGTAIADYSDENRIKTFSDSISSDQQKLRIILLSEMKDAGFAPFLGEWWHFSYGDKEWAAFYNRPAALYSSFDMQKTATVMKIAGGNETVLQNIESTTGRADRGRIGELMMGAYPAAEQSGLLYMDTRRLEMAGGEFCGNASAAAAVLLSRQTDESMVKYGVSGYDGDVVATVFSLATDEYRVRTTFVDMGFVVASGKFKGRSYDIVDMKGIVHILMEDVFPRTCYEMMHRQIVNGLKLSDRDAVGVVWYRRQDDGVYINPVVWVREVDTLYYETACGSGAIAAALCTGEYKIYQPTGEVINVCAGVNGVTTECGVSVTCIDDK